MLWKRRYLSFLVVGSIIIIVFLFLGIFRHVESLVTFIAAPIQRVFWEINVRIKDVGSTLRNNPASFREQNLRLQEQINTLLVENVRLNQKISELQSLSKQITFIESQGFASIPMKVLGRSSDGIAEVIHVDKGSRDHVRMGLVVMVDEGFVVGKIIDLTATTAKVLLITDNSSQFAAVVQNDSQSSGIVSGQHGLSLQMDFIPQLDRVESGMVVMTAGSEPLVPKGLVFGIIQSVSKPTGALFQQASVRSLVDVQKLEVVSALLVPE